MRCYASVRETECLLNGIKPKGIESVATLFSIHICNMESISSILINSMETKIFMFVDVSFTYGRCKMPKAIPVISTSSVKQ